MALFEDKNIERIEIDLSKGMVEIPLDGKLRTIGGDMSMEELLEREVETVLIKVDAARNGYEGYFFQISKRDALDLLIWYDVDKWPFSEASTQIKLTLDGTELYIG